MFDFLKRKKEPELDFSLPETLDTNPEPDNSLTDTAMPEFTPKRSPFESKPEIFQQQPQQSNFNDKDVQILLARVELLNRKIDDVEKKLDEILEIAKK
jgi:hypothetical protein